MYNRNVLLLLFLTIVGIVSCECFDDHLVSTYEMSTKQALNECAKRHSMLVSELLSGKVSSLEEISPDVILDYFDVSEDNLVTTLLDIAPTQSKPGILKTPISPDTDPYVVKTKSEIEQKLEEIRKNSTDIYYTLVASAVYNDTVYWTNDEIINNTDMTDSEKAGLLAIKMNLEMSNYVVTIDTTALVYPGEPGVKTANNNPNGKLTQKQLKDYNLCLYRLKEDLRYCSVTTGALALTIVVGAIGAPVSWLTVGAAYSGLVANDLSCRKGAINGGNRCLQDRNVPRRFKLF